VVVKSKKRGDLLDDLKEAFDNLCKYKMMLNTKKCVFSVSSGKLLSYMILSRWIDMNPKKVEAIEQLQPPQTRKEIHKLAGMMATLSRFISKLGESVICLSTSYSEKQMDFSGMIKWQWLLSNSSNISSPCQHWCHQNPMMCCCCTS
jgi:hypothetical protein